MQDSVGDKPLGIGLSVSLLMLTDKGLGTKGKRKGVNRAIIIKGAYIESISEHNMLDCW